MAYVKIESRDGNVRIEAEDSTISDIYVNGNEVSGRSSRMPPPVPRWAIRLLVYLLFVVFVGFLWARVLDSCERPAHAQSSECELIKDADQRHYCRAVTKKQKTECELIKNADLRHRCRAEVSR